MILALLATVAFDGQLSRGGAVPGAARRGAAGGGDNGVAGGAR